MEKGQLASVHGLNEYVLAHSLRDTDLLRRLREETNRDPMNIMQIPPEQGQFMALLLKAIGAKRAIEIGVYTGYSTLSVARALPDDGYVLACDVEEKWTNIGKKYWAEAGVAHKIDLRLAPAADTLNAALQRGEAGSYDFVFVDADKPGYDTYYELGLKLLKPNGLMALDNMLFFGSVVDSNVLEPARLARIGEATIQSLRDLNKKIHGDERVDMVLLPFADGITLVRKR
jgi:predicted O-methyltransferase YrrM